MSKHFSWFNIALLLLPLVVILPRAYIAWQSPVGFHYESAIFLETKVIPARNYLCENVLHFCEAVGTHNDETLPLSWSGYFGVPQSFGEFLLTDFISRYGVALTLTGAAMTPFPIQVDGNVAEQATTIVRIVHTLSDIIIAMLLVFMPIRLGFPRWVGLLAGIIFALYIPIANEAIFVMRQPIFRLFFILAVFSYLEAVRATSHKWAIFWTLLGCVGVMIAAYSNIPNRLLMWGIFVVFTFVAATTRLRFTLIVTEILFVVIVLFALNNFIYRLSLAGVGSYEDLWSLTLRGSNASNEIAQLTTVMTCREIWCVEGELTTKSETMRESFEQNPSEFIYRLVYSLYGNLSGPSIPWLQQVILNLSQQRLQHQLIVFLGLMGCGWLIGMWSHYWRANLIVGSAAAYFILVFSIITIESLRMTVVIQLFPVTAAIYIYTLYNLYLHHKKQFFVLVCLAVLCYLLWYLPLSFFTVLPLLSVMQTFWLVTALRYISLLTFLILNIFWWLQVERGFNWILSGLLLGFGFILMVVGDQYEANEFVWVAPLNGTVQQSITGVDSRHQQWLILSVMSPDEAEALEITIGRFVVKPSGIPMLGWEGNSFLAFHENLTFFEDRRRWYMIPVPDFVLADDTRDNRVDIQIRAAQTTHFYGSYLLPNNIYIGPGIQRNVDEAFGLLLYNGYDARMTRQFPANNIVSTWQDEAGIMNRTTDLAPALGEQSGIFHVFLVSKDVQATLVATPYCRSEDSQVCGHESDNECQPGGVLANQCNSTDVNLDGQVDSWEQDFMWKFGWSFARINQGLHPREFPIDSMLVPLAQSNREPEQNGQCWDYAGITSNILFFGPPDMRDNGLILTSEADSCRATVTTLIPVLSEDASTDVPCGRVGLEEYNRFTINGADWYECR